MQLEAPAFEAVDYKDFDIAEEYHDDWNRFKIWDNVASNPEPVSYTHLTLPTIYSV